jgi:aminobenzoyl-glutamate utilization protein B
VACGATDIGLKGMINAAKVLAMTGIDIITNPSIAEKAKKELADYVGPGYIYKSMIGDRQPPLDYRAGKNN